MLRAFDVVPREKRELFERNLEAMVRAWSGDPIHSGNGGETVVLDPRPLQRPHPPIWVAAFGPKALAQAGRLGLPYLASPMETLSDLKSKFAAHAQAAAAAGHWRGAGAAHHAHGICRPSQPGSACIERAPGRRRQTLAGRFGGR